MWLCSSRLSTCPSGNRRDLARVHDDRERVADEGVDIQLVGPHGGGAAAAAGGQQCRRGEGERQRERVGVHDAAGIGDPVLRIERTDEPAAPLGRAQV